MSVPATATEDAAGHRARLRERLFVGGAAALQDYELLEYLLALAIPRRDTKPLAKALLREFADLSGVMTAAPEDLARIKGMGETSVAAIKAAHGVALRLLRTETDTKAVLGNWQALLDYLRADMAHHKTERVRVLHLDSRNRLIRDEVMNEGTVDEAPVYAREIVRRALQLGSAAVILVHNHPSGDASPSKADIDITRQVAAALKPLNIALHDHIIMARGGHTSLRAQGLM